jgi:hypothetical protein
MQIILSEPTPGSYSVALEWTYIDIIYPGIYYNDYFHEIWHYFEFSKSFSIYKNDEQLSYQSLDSLTFIDNDLQEGEYACYGVGPPGGHYYALLYQECVYIPISSTESELFSGDINFDGIVDILDIILGISIILGNTDSIEEQLNALDMNQDGDVNVIDIVEMINYILR